MSSIKGDPVKISETILKRLEGMKRDGRIDIAVLKNKDQRESILDLSKKLYESILMVARSDIKDSEGTISNIAAALIPGLPQLIVECLKNKQHLDIASSLMSVLYLMYPYYKEVTRRFYGGLVYDISQKSLEILRENRMVVLSQADIQNVATINKMSSGYLTGT